MEITIDKPTPCSATLQAAVPAADVNALREKILASYVSQAQLPGFRRGKAPKSVILKRYANSINEELTDSLTERVHQEALEKNPELKVLDFGQAETSLQEDGSFTFSSDLTIVPDFELPAYMGLEVTVPSTEVTEEEIDAALKNIAVQRAQFEPVERAAAMGDLVSIDFETSVDGKPTKEVAGDSAGFLAGREGYGAFLEKEDFLPGFAESLVGLSAGDEKDFSLDLAEDFIVSELAGKTLAFHVQAKEVRERRVPEINADLFSDILPGKSMEEIRGVVSKNLKERKEAGNNDSKADQITEQLSAHLDFELPEYLVERELQQTVRRKIHAAIQRGEKLSDEAVSSLQAESREEAKKNLRVYFVIQEIAHREHIDVTEREMLDTISRMAAQEKVTNIKSYLKKLRNGNRIQGIRLSILTSKTIELLVRNAKVTLQEDASEAGTTDAPEAGGAE